MPSRPSLITGHINPRTGRSYHPEDPIAMVEQLSAKVDQLSAKVDQLSLAVYALIERLADREDQE